jgi:hypothetical protein
MRWRGLARRGGRKRPRDSRHRRAGSSALAPFGARRAAASALPQAPPVTSWPPSIPPIAVTRGRPSSRRSSLEPIKTTVKSAGLRPRRRTRWRSAPLWTVTLIGTRPRLSEDSQDQPGAEGAPGRHDRTQPFTYTRKCRNHARSHNKTPQFVRSHETVFIALDLT